MGVALMTHVPHDAVLRKPEAAVQRNRKLYNPQIRREMTSVNRYDLDELFPDFRAKLRNFFLRQTLYVLWRMDRRKEFIFSHNLFVPLLF